MVTNVRPACGPDDSLWRRFSSAWWRICKQSDTASIATFDAEWAELGELLKESNLTGKAMDTAVKWLAKQNEQREQWAARWTWGQLTLGMHSTQRIEAVHSAVSGFLSASTLLVALVRKLDAYGEDVARRADTRGFYQARVLQAASKAHAHPFIDQARSRMLTCNAA